MKDFLRMFGPAIAIAALGLVLALVLIRPAPPKSAVIAGGAAGGAYASVAERYASILGNKKIEARTLTTAGSVDNINRLKSGEAQVAIVQAGLADTLDLNGLKSLGAIFYEPLWVFHSARAPMDSLKDVAGRKVAIGAEGSGARALADLLLTEVGVTHDQFTPVAIGGAEAARALLAGEIDAALIVSDPSPAFITGLAASPDIDLMSMSRAGALERRHPFLSEVTLAAGVLDLARDVPSRDVTLVATAAELVVRQDLHTAIQALLIETAYAEHGRGSVFARAGVFPTPNLADIPLSDEAARYYKNGPTFLRRLFPYDVANFLERAWVLAIPLVTLAYPLVRAAPPVYRWRIRRKIYIWYRDLRTLEADGRAAGTEAQLLAVRQRLATLQAETGRLEVPLSYSDDLYSLRANIRFVSDLMEKLPEPVAASGGG
jgi:uncharacterized protein